MFAFGFRKQTWLKPLAFRYRDAKGYQGNTKGRPRGSQDRPQEANGALQLGSSAITAGTCADLYQWFDDTLGGVSKEEFCKSLPTWRGYNTEDVPVLYYKHLQNWHECFASIGGRLEGAHEESHDDWLVPEYNGHQTNPSTCGYARDLEAGIDAEWPYAEEGATAGPVRNCFSPDPAAKPRPDPAATS